MKAIPPYSLLFAATLLVAAISSPAQTVVPLNVPFACTPPPPNMAGWWPGDGNANDISGNNNNGILEGNVTFPTGEVGQGFGLDGTTADIRVPASPSLNVGLGDGLTIDAWINPTVVSGHQPLVEWNNNSAIGIHVWISQNSTGQLYANLVDTSGMSHIIESAPGLIVANTYQHVAVTYDKPTGIANLFVNGAIVATQSLGIFTPQTSYDVYFGLRPAGSSAGTRFNGSLDEVDLFSRALSQSEIQAIFNAGSAGKCKPGACDVPSSLSTSNVTDTSATLSWDAVSGAVEYQVNYKVVGATKWIVVRSTGNSTTLGGLSADTNYVWRVRTVCSKSPLVASAYSGQVQFTTTEETTTTCDFATNLHTGESANPSDACDIPTNVTEVEILPTHAILRWDAVSGAIGYEIKYYEFYPEQGATLYVCTTRMRVTLENLNRNAAYRYSIRAICSEDPLIVSDYTAESEFRTPRQPR